MSWHAQLMQEYHDRMFFRCIRLMSRNFGDHSKSDLSAEAEYHAIEADRWHAERWQPEQCKSKQGKPI